MKMESFPVPAFGLSVRCVSCGDYQNSETTIGNSANAALRSHAEKEFSRHLLERGWSLDPFVCRTCRIKISLQTVEDMLPPKEGNL